MRRPRTEDATAIFEEYAQDPEVTRFLVWRPHQRHSDTQDFLRGCLARWDTGEEFSWVVTLPLADRAVGMVACRVRGFMADVGYVLARRLWDRGLMTEAVRPVVTWAAGLEPVYRVWAVCDTANAASARVLEKAGMEREGVLCRWIIHPSVSPEPRDCFVYARVRPGPNPTMKLTGGHEVGFAV